MNKTTIVAAAIALCIAQAFAQNHTVTFRRMNGTVLSKIEVAHGADASGLVPALPVEADMTARTWDCADRLASVTNDVTCWALYEASTAKSPSTSIASQSVVDRTTPYSLEEYFQIYDNLAWSDEFSGTSLSVASSSWFSNGKNWLYDTEQRNSELQKYTTTGGNHIVSDGTLKLRAKRESSGGKSFTSGSIRSQGTVAFRYGRCEIRAKLTKQKGTWPAFWLMGTSGGWPDCGELDVFEQINGSDWIGGNFHLADGRGGTTSNSALACPEDGAHWGDAFHRIGVIMTEHELVWYVDDHIFKRMDVRNKTRYPMTDGKSWYILLNLAFGGGWPGQTSADDASIAGFQSEDFEIDYCRIFTNTTAGNTVSRGLEPEVARLSGPVKATVWRGWQMKYGKAGANYFQNHLIGEVGKHIKTAMREYFTRDGADIVTFLTRPDENTGSTNLANPFDVPGYSALGLSPDAGSNWKDVDGDTREKLLTTVMFDRNRFSPSDSAIGSLPLTNDANYTNCCAVVAELVEKDSGAKVKVVSVNLSQTNGTDYATLFNKLNQFKNERTILLFQSMDSAYHTPLKNQASSKLDKAYKYLGEYKVWPTYQFSYATTNCVSATATNPAPLSVPKSNGQASGVHTNQAYCATVQFEAEPQIEYGQLDMSAFSKKMDVTFSGYSGTTLTDFPVLVKLSTAISGFSYGDFQKTNGGDLRFADSTGKLLPHEIDTWNPSGVSTVWVKVPSLTANGKITACYGCAEPPEVAAKDVWDDDYVGVWHLGESAVPMKESSETSSDFTQSSGSGIGFAAQGIVGGAVDFGASGNSRALIAPDHDALDGFSQCTFEAWTFVTNRTSGSDVNKGLLSKRINYNNEASYYLHDTGSATKFYISANGTSSTDMSTNVKADENAWTHQVYTFDGGGSDNNVGAWKNGVDVGKTSKSVAAVNAGSAPLYLGNFGPSGSSIDARNFPGKIDEVRISKVARSAAWIKATHDTIANANFATCAVQGATQPPAPSVASRTLPFRRGTNCRGLDANPYSTSTAGSTYIYGLDSTYTDIKEKGFDYVRFSVDLTKYYDQTNDRLYTSGNYDIGIIDGFIRKFLNAGLYVHLLMGRVDGGSINLSDNDQKERFKRVWQLVAEHYQGWSDKLAFELCNEPGTPYGSLNNLEKQTVALIRQTNPTRLILWPVGDGSQPWVLTQAANPPKFDWVTLPEGDTNIAVVVHTYAPADFTHQGADWSYDANGNKRNYHVDLTDAYRAKLREDLTYLSQYAKAHPDVPIVLNEFGVMCGKSYESDAHEWLSTVREFCDANKIAWAHFEYTDFNNFKGMASRSHPTGDTWRTNVVDALFPKGWDDVPGTYGQVDLSAFSRKVTVSFTGYAGTAPLVDFPVLVKLSTAISGFSYADFQKANGGDLRFVDSHGNLIPHEIDTWNSSGVSTVWVKVPELSASTRIYACYGCANPPDVTAMDVWDDDYVGVWHLGEGTLPLRESTIRGPSFTQKCGEGVGFASSGVVGSSVAFGNSFSNGVIAVGHDNLDGFEKFTVEAWTKQSAHKTNAGILSKRRASNKSVSYYMFDTGSKTRFCVSDNGTNVVVSSDLVAPATDGSWQHQAYSLDTTTASENVRGYLNGLSSGTASKSVGRVNSDIGFLTLGNLQPSAKNNSFEGQIDEVRISKCVRSADWIKATHDTVAKADFATYSFGDVPTPEPQRILYVSVAAGVTNTLDAALVTENITNIVKQGAGVLVASAIPGYTGTITVEGGVWQGGASAGDFGGEGTVIDVLDGASLALRGANGNGLVENALSGKTVNLRGAKCSSALGKVVVSSTANVKIGAATVNLTDSDETLFLDKMGSASWYFFRLNSGTLNLGGRTLVVSSSGANFETSATIENGGTVDMRNTMFAAETLAPSFTGTGTLKSNGTLNLKLPFSAQGWTVVGSPATLTGNVNRWPTDTSYPGWDGPISLSGNSRFANYAGATKGVSNTVFNAKGAISGSGTLGVGPGWLNLHSADNTYSGAVTVNGCAPAANQPVLPGGGGIGLWNGAACFPNASSITFTNTARLAFMDATACSVPNVKFVALEGETQSVSGGVHTARSTMAGFVKEGAGTLLFDSPVSVTGLGDVKGGTLKVAYAAPLDGTQEGVLAQHPVFSGLRFAPGTTLDLSDNAAVVTGDLDGSPSVVNSGIFGVSGKWTLGSPTDRLTVTGANAALGEQAVAGCLGFQSGATFEIPSDRDAAFIAAAESNGGRIEVAQANYVLAMLDPQTPLPMPTASSSTNPRWSMEVGEDTRTVYLVLAPDSSSPAFAHAVDVTFSGYSGGTALADFPVLVRLSPNISGFSYADFNLPNGGDLRFYDESGNMLSHEIDTWDESGVSTVWVKVPSLTATTKITAKYGSTDTLPAVNAKDVWDDDYVGVWHLGESALPMKESSETSSDFTTAYGTTIEYAADGVVGGSVGFPAGGQYNSLAAPDHDALDGFSQFTIETWTYQTEHKNNAGVLAKRAGFAKETAYYLFGVSTSTLSTMPLCVATNKNANVDWAYHQVQTLGAWNHLAYTVDMTKTTSNICGAKNGIMSTWKSSKDFHGTMANCASDLCLGNLYVNGKDNSFNGRIDEVRISKVIRSAAWIKATYETVMKPDFARYEAQGATALSGYKAWMNANELVGAPDEKTANGIENGVRYAFDIAPEKGPDAVGDPIIQVVRDANGNPSVQSRDLATGRDDVTFGILATPDLTDWSNAALVPMTKFATDGLWRPTASESSGYVFPSQMFFKYTIEIQE